MSAAASLDVASAPPRSVRGRLGMACLIFTESALFLTFVVTYLFYIGRNLTGPYPADVIELPLVLVNSVFLLSSSATIVFAVRALERGQLGRFRLWWMVTFLFGLEFLVGTGIEWRKLIVEDGLTLQSNLFGSTFYTLVGLHLAHVTIGVLVMLFIIGLAFRGAIRQDHSERMEILSWYWHFVDAVWIIVFTTVYVIGR